MTYLLCKLSTSKITLWSFTFYQCYFKLNGAKTYCEGGIIVYKLTAITHWYSGQKSMLLHMHIHERSDISNYNLVHPSISICTWHSLFNLHEQSLSQREKYQVFFAKNWKKNLHSTWKLEMVQLTSKKRRMRWALRERELGNISVIVSGEKFSRCCCYMRGKRACWTKDEIQKTDDLSTPLVVFLFFWCIRASPFSLHYSVLVVFAPYTQLYRTLLVLFFFSLATSTKTTHPFICTRLERYTYTPWQVQ